MVLFKKAKKPGETEIDKEGSEDVLHLNYENYPKIPSIEDDPIVFSSIIEKLASTPNISRIVFHQKKRYEYSVSQTLMLAEIARIYNHFTRQKSILTQAALEVFGPMQDSAYRIRNLQYLVLTLLKSDPVGAFVESKRLLRQENINSKDQSEDYKMKLQPYLAVLNDINSLLINTKLIANSKDYIDGYNVGNREVYKSIFKPMISPDFMYTRLLATPPLDASEIDSYSMDKNTHIQIFNTKETIKPLYHLIPPEFQISEDKYELLDLARKVLSEHQPKAEEFIDSEKMRETFFNIGKDLISELSQHKNIPLSFQEIEELANILVRYTVGFGLVETLLQDEEIQDIAINSPAGSTPIFIVHGKYDECVTNVIPSIEDVDSWASKFRLISARPLDEANPVLDTELSIPAARARVAIIGKPLSPGGLAFSIRRHRDKPWTLPLFIKNNMMNDLAAGLLSFIVDGSRSILVAGTRGSGKCVDGNTLIQLSDGSLIKIKELIGNQKSKIGDGEIYNPKAEYKVPCLLDYNLINSNITDVWKRKSPEKVVKLITRSGKEIITTQEHPYFIYNDGIKNISADELKSKDLIAIPRGLDIKDKDVELKLDKNDKFIFEEFEDYYLINGKTNSNQFKMPKKITPELAEFLGYIIGDGHLDLEAFELHNKCDKIRARYKKILHEWGLPYREFKSRTSIVVQTSCRNFSRILNKYFEIPFGKKSDKVVIPQLILKSNNRILSKFLRAYFDTDGYTPKDKRDIELVTASKLMSEQLGMVMLRFGIVGFTKIKKIKQGIYYRFLIRGEFVNKFSQNISFSHPKKLMRLEKIMSMKLLNNTNVDIIPQGNILFKKLRNKLRVSQKELRDNTGKDCWNHENYKYNMSRATFKKVMQYYKLRYYKLKLLECQINSVREFANFNYNNFVSMTEKIRILLALSYGTLALDVKSSETKIRKTLQETTQGDLEKLNSFNKVYNHYVSRLAELDLVLNIDNSTIHTISKFVDIGIISYAQLSRNTGIKESSLKGYIYGGTNISQDKNLLLQGQLNIMKQDLAARLLESKEILEKINLSFMVNDGVKLGIILSSLRQTLNIKNEDLICENLCSGSVSNFFNGVYNCNLQTVKAICKQIVEIYDNALSKETEELIKEADALANSDIFWDEIKTVELISKVDDFVYDLSVENTHNFIANGIIAHNTSLLGSVLVEIMRKYRVITVEDTKELPVDSLRDLGYNIQDLKVRSALAKGGSELSADEGIRTSLRMGDSSLIVGEVRSTEAIALYEAMRTGALANTVAGTIHGDSPYGVYDRVVNDLQVPKTSFKATDIIIIANPIRSADGLHKFRRITQITEVRKEWEDDPLRENGFVDLMRYDSKTDSLIPTEELINGDSEIIKDIASKVKEWSGSWDAIWDNILLRAKLKQTIVDYAKELNNPDLLEAKTVIQMNDEFHRISDRVKQKLGYLDSKQIFFEWEEYFKKYIKLNY